MIKVCLKYNINLQHSQIVGQIFTINTIQTHFLIVRHHPQTIKDTKF